MTPTKLQEICDKNQGQTAVAKITGYDPAYISRMTREKDKITDTVTRRFRLFFPDEFKGA